MHFYVMIDLHEFKICTLINLGKFSPHDPRDNYDPSVLPKLFMAPIRMKIFEKIQTSNTLNSYMITKFCYPSKT